MIEEEEAGHLGNPDICSHIFPCNVCHRREARRLQVIAKSMVSMNAFVREAGKEAVQGAKVVLQLSCREETGQPCHVDHPYRLNGKHVFLWVAGANYSLMFQVFAGCLVLGQCE